MYVGRVQQRTSTRNTINLKIPGFAPTLQVSFPEGRLPVCEKCKKNYKTRDMCRTQAEHTDLPWTSVYICVTLDDSCIDSNNKLKKGTYTTRTVDSQSYCYKSDVNSDTLICASCKTKNYTRKQCRIKSRHRALPWSTVQVVLSCEASEEEMPITNVENNSNPGKRSISDEGDEKRPSKRRDVGNTTSPESTDDSSHEKPSNKNNEPVDDTTLELGDDIEKVEESRTFLVEVNKDICIIKVRVYSSFCNGKFGFYLHSTQMNFTQFPLLQWLAVDKHKSIPIHSLFASSSQSLQNTQSLGQAWSQRNLDSYTQERSYPFLAEQTYPIDNQVLHPFASLTQPQYAYWQRSNPNMARLRATPREIPVEYPHQYYPEYYDPQQQPHGQILTPNWYGGSDPSIESAQAQLAKNIPVAQIRSPARRYPNNYSETANVRNHGPQFQYYHP